MSLTESRVSVLEKAGVASQPLGRASETAIYLTRIPPAEVGRVRPVIQISAQSVFRGFAIAVTGLAVIGLAFAVIAIVTGHDGLMGYGRIFDLDREGNVPSWYSGVSLLFCASLLWLISHAARAASDPYSKEWRLMAGIFVGLSLDEVAALHERTMEPLRALHLTGFLHYSWVVLAFPFLMWLGLRLRKFIFALPSATRNWFLISGTIFVLGAVGIEMIGAKVLEINGNGAGARLLSVLEETMEMTGILLFIRALLTYLTTYSPRVSLRFE